MPTYPDDPQIVWEDVREKGGILVFGSNRQGRHGRGMAQIARDYFGAELGNPSGRQGQSYAIITKDLGKANHPSVSEDEIIQQISDLYLYALENHGLQFYIPYFRYRQDQQSGRNLNGYRDHEMARMFSGDIPGNIWFQAGFFALVNTAGHR